jgi:hypothetical protein
VSAEQVAVIPQCAECSERWLPGDEERWSAYLDTDDELALEIYAKVMERKRDPGERVDALIRGADWAVMGSNGATPDESLSVPATGKPPCGGYRSCGAGTRTPTT